MVVNIFYLSQSESKIRFLNYKRSEIFYNIIFKNKYTRCGGKVNSQKFWWKIQRESMKKNFNKSLKFKHLNRDMKELIFTAYGIKK